MDACPFCGFINKPRATRCECCLGDLTESAAAPVAQSAAPPAAVAPAPVQPKAPAAPTQPAAAPPTLQPATSFPKPPGTLATPGASAASSGPASSSPASSSDDAVEPPIFTRASFAKLSQESAAVPVPILVPGTSRMVLVGLMVVGLVGGTLLMLPRSGKRSGLLAWMKRSPGTTVAPNQQARAAETGPASPSASPGASQAPPAPSQAPAVPPAAPSAKPSPIPAAPSAAPATPAQTMLSAAAREEEAADTQFKIAVGFLRKQQTVQARQSLQDLMQRYPGTRTAVQARELLAQIPVEAPSGAPPVARSQPPAPSGNQQRPTTLRERLEQERPSGRSSTITSDELAGSSRAPAAPAPRQVVVPPSLQASQRAPIQSAAVSAQDDVRITSMVQEAGGLALNLEYRLGTQRTRPIFVGAWVQVGTASRYFGYSTSPLSQGNGSARVLMPGATRDVTSLRIAFFEEGGQRFFIKDVIVPK